MSTDRTMRTLGSAEQKPEPTTAADASTMAVRPIRPISKLPKPSTTITAPTSTFSFSAAAPAPEPGFSKIYTSVFDSKQNEIDLLKAKLVTRDQECEELRNVEAKLRAELEKILAENTIHNANNMNDFAEMEEAKRKLEETNSVLQREIQRLRDDVKAKDEHITDIESRYKEWDKELETQKQNVTTAKNEIKKLKDESDKREEYVGPIEEQLQDSLKRIDKLEQDLRDRDEAVARERQNAKDMEDKKKAVDKELADFVRDNRRLNIKERDKELLEKREEVIAKDAQISRLEASQEILVADYTSQFEALRNQIKQLKVDAKDRASTAPEHYKEPVTKKSKGTDLRKDLEIDIASDDSSSVSGSSVSDSDESSKKVPEPIEIIREVIREVIVEVPGPVITKTVTRNVVRTVRVKNRPLEGWFGTERDIAVIIIQNIVAALSWIMGIEMAMASRLREETVIIQDPVEVIPDERFVDEVSSNGTDAPINMQASVSVGAQAATDGPATGADPSRPGLPAEAANPATTEALANLLDLIPPIQEEPDDERPRLQASVGDSDNLSRIVSNSSGSHSHESRQFRRQSEQSTATDSYFYSSSAGGDDPTDPEPFFDILGARRPPIRGTLFTMLLHLLVYYLMYLAAMTYFERNMWIQANDTTRLATFELIRRYRNGVLNLLIGPGAAARWERFLLVFVQKCGVGMKSYPLAG